jgi:RNA polymerase sigma factor (sigma-70 family)
MQKSPQEQPSAPQSPETPVAAGDSVLAGLIRAHNRALHAFLMTRVRDEQEARDVAQEAYVQMLQLDRPDAINFMRAYLFRTAANIAINRAKQRRVRGALDQVASADVAVDLLSPDRRVLAAEELEILQRALLELSPKCRRAFVLFRVLEWSQERIARDLGVQQRMVRHYLAQAGLYCRLRMTGCSAAEAKARVGR